MSREENHPEDKKLSAVKSWFTRSISFGGVHGSSTSLAAAAASKGQSEGNGNNGEDQDTWGGFNTTLKQLSMRRTKVSMETEKEGVPGSPSMTPRNVTPLVPLTPLRWKSNPSEQDELQSAAATVERSRLGLSASNVTVSSEEHCRSNLPTDGSEVENKEDRDIDVQTKTVQSTAEADESEDDSLAMESPSGQDMKASPGDDVMTMTIDFLRARLLAERSASKAAKQRIQELGTKVMELEEKLEQVIEDKKKAEKCAEEALLKLLTGNFSQVADCTARAAQSIASLSPPEGLHVASGLASGGEEIKEELQRVESSVGDFSRTNSIGSSLESKDSGDSRRKSPQVRSEDRSDVDGNGDVWVTPKHMFVSEGESPKKLDNRAAIENRLRKMWCQLSADMSTLAKDSNKEEFAQEQLMNWMDQVPAVLQDRSPHKPVEQTQGNGGQQKAMYPRESHFELSPPEGLRGKVTVQADAKSMQREWDRNCYESEQRMGQSNQRDYPRSDYNNGPHDLADDFVTPHHGVYRSKSSTDCSHPHMPKSDARKGFYSDSDLWGVDLHGRDTSMDSQHNEGNIEHRQGLAYPAVVEHPLRQVERSAAVPRMDGSDSRVWSEKQLQPEYQDTYFQQTGAQCVRRQIGYPPTYCERDFQGRPYAHASLNQSAQDGYRNSQIDNGGAHPMLDIRDGNHRQRDSNHPYRSYHQSERNHRHGHRRSHSADSSNWPAEEDYRVADVPQQQRNLSGVIHPSHPVHPGRKNYNFYDRDHHPSYEDDLIIRHEPGHRQDKNLDIKTHGFEQPLPHEATQNRPVDTPEPKLFLGYGPAYDAPRDYSPNSQQSRVSNKSNVTDVLLRLQKAKASIQKSGSDRARSSTDFSKPEHCMDHRVHSTRC